MNKKDLVNELQKMGRSRAEARDIVDLIVSCIRTTLQNGKDFRLYDLGVFRIKKMPARPARNPITGKSIIVKKHRRVKFTPAESLKILVK